MGRSCRARQRSKCPGPSERPNELVHRMDELGERRERSAHFNLSAKLPHLGSEGHKTAFNQTKKSLGSGISNKLLEVVMIQFGGLGKNFNK